MTASDTRPDGIPLPDLRQRSGMRPRDRRIAQAIALVCAVAAMLVIPWVDETNLMHASVKPPEKVTTLPEGQIGELAGAKWKVFDRRTAAPLGNRQGGDVVELRLELAVRPADAAAAKAVGSYGLQFRFHDDDGRQWTATALRTGEPKAGVAMRITVKGTVPRAKADRLELRIRAPKETLKQGDPLVSLRFSR
ncbi:hypothetical protein SAMN05443665_102174 [Actinomadura meyerae]|jgi:hypothetical protein|uniref:Uncharacterized protein n=1 Tax=Actinomadura meyerae TaxID=240840 RepID=A0A239LAD2_9ACTN|nr:hypothetical protein [Actinomadura meyerae]SNT26504.1 hypothetical protein SAMN05443665_102174 [Actinomadura meyerae]